MRRYVILYGLWFSLVGALAGYGFAKAQIIDSMESLLCVSISLVAGGVVGAAAGYIRWAVRQ